MRRHLCAPVLALLALSAATPSLTLSAQQVSSQALVEKAGAYLRDLLPKLTYVVAEEQYEQQTTLTRQRRTLRSDYLVVRMPSGDFAAFRDVFDVDGKSVRDRDERLQKLFLTAPAATAIEQAQRIANEAVRYNIWNVGTINHPYLSMAFVQDEYRSRFRLQSPRLDPSLGADVYAVAYDEFQTPTILQGDADRNVPSRGRWWIQASTGRVLKTELRLGAASGRAITSTEVTTSFRYDAELGLIVPTQMEEYYSGNMRGKATYGRFRRFAVTTDETLKSN